jgi:hypothetical protein
VTARQEILAAARSLAARSSDSTFTVEDVLNELHRRGTRYADGTIRTHVVSSMCADAPVNHAVVYSDLDRVGRGRYRLAIRGADPRRRIDPPLSRNTVATS